ncbi:SH3 domain-containing protein [Mycolicibacterium stellerae]|uniref:hypothetical protein n=1 Tax=Mycolicibacterium stellerae TaxID=2358193 RepID=UPI0013DE25D7|nr:hypothetical protein [Mycolicibacterium stellerae]
MASTPAQALPMIPLAPQCERYDLPSRFVLKQSDHWTVEMPASGQQLQGAAKATDGNGEEKITGSVVGGLTGPRLIDFTVNWDNGHRSRYTGRVYDDGQARGGRQDIRAQGAGPDNTSWDTITELTCIPEAAEQGQIPDKKDPDVDVNEQAPPPGTVKVTEPTDVYDAPLGEGNEVGVLLAPGTLLQIIDPGCNDDWCHLAVSNAPGGQGWVYKPHLGAP